MKPIIVFGNGEIAEVAYFYFTNDSVYSVAAFSAHELFIKDTSLFGLPVVPFEYITKIYPPQLYDMFVAIGYNDVNKRRANIYRDAKLKGYKLVSYISSKCTSWIDIRGDNCFILEDNTLQPFVQIGKDVTLWSGNHIGHHSIIGNHCFVASHIVISGNCVVGDYTFIGVNSTLRDNIIIGKSNIIGAGSLIMKSTDDNQVFIEKRTNLDPRNSYEIGF